MREIKFRAWDGKGMSRAFGIEDAAFEGFPRPITDDNGEYDTRANITWMQFTGLRDKNGKEIYEGDIIHGLVITDTPYTAECPSLQCFHWYQELEDSIEERKHIEVIGNIYENPELLTV